MTDLDGAATLVTGAAGTIGRSIATVLAGAGARLAISDIDEEGLTETAGLLGDGHEVIVADLSTVPGVEGLVDDAARRLDGLDVLVNNAAALEPGGTILDCTQEVFDRALAVNTRAPFFAVRSALPHMLAVGRGTIVNVASILGLVGLAGQSPYAVSKVGVIQLTRQVAVEYADRGIRCNAVCPGTTAPPIEPGDDEAKAAVVRRYAAQYPMGRIAEPQEIAAVVAFLASDAASFMNGSIVVADGGYTSR